MTGSDTEKTPLDRRHLIDLVIRFALGLAFTISAGIYFRAGYNEMDGADFHHLSSSQLGNVITIFSVALYTFMVACLYVVRLRPVSKFAGAVPCAAAIMGGFLLSALALFSPREDLPLSMRIFACILVVAGNLFSIVILMHLGRSFSIVPEGRRLVTKGPYSVVRHPLYLAEAVSTVGTMINFLSPWVLVLVGVQLILQLVRIHYEEDVLKEHFPEYEEYAEKTWRILPGIY